MGTHHLSKLICGMHSWKRYRQMTLSFDDSNGSPGNGWSKFFLNFSPTTQHDQKGNHGYYFSASIGCLSNRVTDSEAQAKATSHLSVHRGIYIFPRALSFPQIMLCSFTIPEHSDFGDQQKLLAKLRRRDNFL